MPSSRKLGARWSTATGVLMSASSICRRLLHLGLCLNVPLYRINFTTNHRQLHLQWAHEHRAWQVDWHHVIISDESRFNLFDYDDRVHVERYADQRYIPECVIEQHSGQTAGVMVWGVISYHVRSNFLQIKSNLNSNIYICEVLLLEVYHSFKASLELSFNR